MSILLSLLLLFGGINTGSPDRDCGIRGKCPAVLITLFLERHHR